jgi:hypothetical protein
MKQIKAFDIYEYENEQLKMSRAWHGHSVPIEHMKTFEKGFIEGFNILRVLFDKQGFIDNKPKGESNET